MRRFAPPFASITLALAACNSLTGVEGLRPCDTCGDAGTSGARDATSEQPTLPEIDANVEDAFVEMDATTDGGTEADADAGIGCNGTADCERVVFVTNQAFTAALGGIAGGDAKCQDAANVSTSSRIRGRTFVAWLSTLTTSPFARLTHGTKPYVRPDGATIAVNWDDLTNGGLVNGIAIDELGGNRSGNSAWTGTNTNGATFAGFSCTDWTATDGNQQGERGNVGGNGGGWSGGGLDPCSTTGRLYCFEK